MSLSKSQKKLLLAIAVSAVLMGCGILISELTAINDLFSMLLLTTAYVVSGYSVFIKAGKNISNGKIFDENFLMCIATVGAYVLGDYTECVAVMLFYQIGEFFQGYAVAKSRKSIKDLMDICPEYANIERDGVLAEVDPYEVEVGDIIVVKPGEKLPLDGVIVEGESELDTASLTGESMPRGVKKGDEVLSGCINLNSVLKIMVTKSFENSTVSKILELVENSGFNKARSEKFITRFASVYTPLVVIAAMITAFVPPIFGGNLLTWIKRALIFLVISCPCALVVSVPMSFFASIGSASKKGILIKGANYLELMGKLDTVVFDKTGTLTRGKFTVKQIFPVSCTEKDLIEYAAAAEFYSDHPIAQALKNACEIKKFADIHDFKILPGSGVSAVYKDKMLLCGNKKLLAENGYDVEFTTEYKGAVYVCYDGSYKGYIIVADSVKSDATSTVSFLKKQGIKTYMLTGDTAENSLSIATEVSIDEVYSELLPEDKVTKLEEIRKSKSGKCIAYVGDGINDAPVLAIADVGIAMGSLGSDAAIEAADIVVTDDKLSKIELCFKICKKTSRIVYQNVFFSLGVKLAVMLLGIAGFANMWMAVFADVGVAFIAILNAMRAFRQS